jgi:uncharacterized membrane protein YcjF (UPF0283 family)
MSFTKCISFGLLFVMAAVCFIQGLNWFNEHYPSETSVAGAALLLGCVAVLVGLVVYIGSWFYRMAISSYDNDNDVWR